LSNDSKKGSFSSLKAFSTQVKENFSEDNKDNEAYEILLGLPLMLAIPCSNTGLE